jgi:phage-related protein
MVVKALRPVKEFLDALPHEQRAEIDAVLDDLQNHGLSAPLISMRQIQGKLWEIRVSRNRIFYVMIESDTMVLLHAYKKQSQKAPRHEIETALRRMRELLAEGD